MMTTVLVEEEIKLEINVLKKVGLLTCVRGVSPLFDLGGFYNVSAGSAHYLSLEVFIVGSAHYLSLEVLIIYQRGQPTICS